MKLKLPSFLLALLVAVSVTLTAFAAVYETDAEDKTVVEETSVETVVEPEAEPEEEAEPEFPFSYNGETMTEFVYRNIGGVNYAAVASFVAALDPNAVAEEENGTVTVSAVFVKEIVDVDGQLASVEEDTLTLTATIGEKYVIANGRYLYVEEGVPAIDGKVALPVRLLAQVFNLNTDWVDRVVLLSTREGAGAYIEDAEIYYDPELLYWLSRIIYSESGNQSLTGKLAVGNVVMNRLNSPDFPNTIKGVLFQKNQFSPAMSGSIYRDPGASSVVAAKLVLDGAVVLDNALFFNRAGMNTFASRNRTYVATIGAHAFYA